MTAKKKNPINLKYKTYSSSLYLVFLLQPSEDIKHKKSGLLSTFYKVTPITHTYADNNPPYLIGSICARMYLEVLAFSIERALLFF